MLIAIWTVDWMEFFPGLLPRRESSPDCYELDLGGFLLSYDCHFFSQIFISLIETWETIWLPCVSPCDPIFGFSFLRSLVRWLFLLRSAMIDLLPGWTCEASCSVRSIPDFQAFSFLYGRGSYNGTFLWILVQDLHSRNRLMVFIFFASMTPKCS